MTALPHRPPRYQRARLAWVAVLCSILLMRVLSANPALMWDQDEPRLYENAMWLLTGQTTQMDLFGYSPAMFWLNGAVHCVVAACPIERYDILGVVGAVRALSIAADLLSASLLFALGAVLGFPWAGAWSGLFFTLPRVFVYTHVALTEAFQATLILLAVYAFVRALRDARAGWVYLATGAALLCFLFKYSALPFIGLGALAALIQALRGGRRWWGVLAAQVLLAGLVGVLLFIFNPPQQLIADNHLEAVRFANGSAFTNLLNLADWGWIYYAAGWQVRLHPLFIAPLLALGTWRFWQQEPLWWRRTAWVVLLLGVALFPWYSLSYIFYLFHPYRYLVVTGGGLALFICISTALLWAWLRPYWGRRRAVRLLLSAGIVIVAANSIAAWVESGLLVFARQWPTVRASIPAYSLRALPEDGAGLLIYPDYAPLFCQQTVVPRCQVDYPSARPIVDYDANSPQQLAVWRAKGLRYALFSAPGLASLRQKYPAEASTLLPLKRFPLPEDAAVWLQPPLWLVQIAPPQRLSGARLGAVQLIGVDILPTAQAWRVRPYWQADVPPAHDAVRLEWRDGAGRISAQGALQRAGLRPTSTWDDRDEVHIGAWLSISPPPTGAQLWLVWQGQGALGLGVNAP